MSNLQSVTRRDFLRTTGLGIAGLALAACAAPVAPELEVTPPAILQKRPPRSPSMSP